MLTNKEIQVLELRQKGLTQIEVALKLSISQAAVCSFERKAKRKIQEAFETKQIAEKLKIKIENN